jgi:twinkle protein
MNERLAAFDESAKMADVVNIKGHEQPDIDDDYLNALMMPKDIDFAKYAITRESEKDNIKPTASYFDELKASLQPNQALQGSSLPWTKTHDNLRFRDGEVTMWHGYSGHKKSMVLGYAALGFIQQNAPVCIASFETKPVKTLARMLKQATGTTQPTEHALNQFIKFTDSKLWMYDKQGTITQDTLFGVIYYAADKLKCKHFVIDSLMRVVAGEEDYNAQKNFVVTLCNIALETGIHIHMVHHNRKGDESNPAGSQGANGTGAIKDNVHNAIEVWTKYKDLDARNKADDHETPDIYMICTKQREGEWEGAIGLYFQESSLQFSGSKDGGTRSWIR